MKIADAAISFSPFTITVETLEELTILVTGVGKAGWDSIQQSMEKDFDITVGEQSKANYEMYLALKEKLEPYRGQTLVASVTRCTLGVGCEEAGTCYADYHNRPDMCGMEEIYLSKQYVDEMVAKDMQVVYETFQQEPEENPDDFDHYGNPIDGSSLPYCCYPDCGCDGERLCMAESGANFCASILNIEKGSL